ncbi:hypothetical protein ABTJ86_15235, partial [Acinetobacter baumannii]
MGNKYYDQLVNNDSHFEITFNDFEEFITFIRPDKLHVKDLMTQLRLEFNPSAVNFPFFKISVHDKFHRTLILSGFCLLKIAKISL